MDKEELNLVTLARKYADEDAARELLESLRWPDGVRCPHCRNDGAYKLTGNPDSKSPVRKGVWKCKACRKQFTVRVGTIFEDSHLPLSTWVMGIHIMCASKKGVSAKQLERMLGITYKSAWFMAHRIRYAMTEGGAAAMLSGTVEVDETYVGGKPRYKGQSPRGRGTRKTPVMALVERGGGVRTAVLKNVTGKNLREHIRASVAPGATVNTDEFGGYARVHHDGYVHNVVVHSAKEYARGEVHTNTAESFFSLLKRGVVGSFHHVSKHRLHRYANEFAFRWNNRKLTDGERTEVAVGMFEGKRLMYRDSLA